jgi:hypothetical protein
MQFSCKNSSKAWSNEAALKLVMPERDVAPRHHIPALQSAPSRVAAATPPCAAVPRLFRGPALAPGACVSRARAPSRASAREPGRPRDAYMRPRCRPPPCHARLPRSGQRHPKAFRVHTSRHFLSVEAMHPSLTYIRGRYFSLARARRRRQPWPSPM